MLNLRKGFAARRYWDAMHHQQRQHARPADREALEANARRGRADIAVRLEELRRQGVTAIEDYWPLQRCVEARAELDKLMQSRPDWVRHFSCDSDKRVFGAEVAGPAAQLFHDDAFLKSVGEIVGGLQLYNLATLGSRIDATEANRGSGDGWHRDTFGFQFKAIIYLCDVTDENGPFEYLCGSHTAWRFGLDSTLGRLPAPPDSRIDAEHMARMIADGAVTPRRFTGKAGTVILANTAGVHGGAPLKSGHRYALTNYYYFPYQIGRSMIDKFLPLPDVVLKRLEPFLESERLQSSAAGVE